MEGLIKSRQRRYSEALIIDHLDCDINHLS